MYRDQPETDPILDTLNEVFHLVDANHYERQDARAKRGDDPLPTEPFITVTVETATRTHTGRIFGVNRRDNIIDLYNEEVTNTTMTTPDHIIRASAIVSVHVAENVYLLPVEFPMTRTDLDAHTTAFLAKAATILTDPDHDEPHATADDILARLLDTPAPIPVTREQCDALRDAAQPVNDLMLNTPISGKWDRYATHITRTLMGHNTRTVPAFDDDPHLNIEVLNVNDTYPGPTTLLMFLTHGVPLNFCYPETHQQALDAYQSQILTTARVRDLG